MKGDESPLEKVWLKYFYYSPHDFPLGEDQNQSLWISSVTLSWIMQDNPASTALNHWPHLTSLQSLKNADRLLIDERRPSLRGRGFQAGWTMRTLPWKQWKEGFQKNANVSGAAVRRPPEKNTHKSTFSFISTRKRHFSATSQHGRLRRKKPLCSRATNKVVGRMEIKAPITHGPPQRHYTGGQLCNKVDSKHCA